MLTNATVNYLSQQLDTGSIDLDDAQFFLSLASTDQIIELCDDSAVYDEETAKDFRKHFLHQIFAKKGRQFLIADLLNEHFAEQGGDQKLS